MTLQTTIADIDATYPVAGQDNNTQGFRDNFSSIKSALTLTEEALSKLQTNTVKIADLDTNLTVENDLNGSTIKNGFYNNFHGEVHDPGAVSNDININIENGPFQIFMLSSTPTEFAFTFAGWPENNKYACVRCHFYSDTLEQQITVDNIDIGKKYTIYELGTTDNNPANLNDQIIGWNEIAGTDDLVYADENTPGNNTFVAALAGTGSGKVKQWREVTLHGGIINAEVTDLLPLQINPNGDHLVLEAWSYNGGADIFVRLLGTYASIS